MTLKSIGFYDNNLYLKNRRIQKNLLSCSVLFDLASFVIIEYSVLPHRLMQPGKVVERELV